MAKVLVIDDEKKFRATLKEVLESVGHEVNLAEDGNQGIKMFAEKPIDLIIIDLIIPDKERLELISEIKKIDPDSKIIAMYGGGSSGTTTYSQCAKRLGAQLALQKPFSTNELHEKIEFLFNADVSK